MTSKRYNTMATAFAHELHDLTPEQMPAAWAIINVWMGFEKTKNPRFDKERFTAYVWEMYDEHEPIKHRVPIKRLPSDYPEVEPMN